MSKGFHLRPMLPVIAAVLLACGCSERPADGAADHARAMRFGTARVSTRGVVGTAELQAAGSAFAVWGICRKGDAAPIRVFDGTRVVSDGGQWSYGEPQYWLPMFTYDFRALYPADLPAGASVAFVGDGPHLTVGDFDAVSGVDLLAASPAPIECDPGRTMGPVNLEFRHLLARVRFVGRSDEQHLGTGRRIVIDRAVLYGIRTRGDWSGASFAEELPGSWTPRGELLGAESGTYVAESVELATDGTDLFADERALLFIPQELTDAVLEITYHYDCSESDRYTGRVALKSVSERWEAGKSYRYPFTISDRIFFDTPAVEAWQYAPINGSDFNVDL